jgi:hypothetical protein
VAAAVLAAPHLMPVVAVVLAVIELLPVHQAAVHLLNLS